MHEEGYDLNLSLKHFSYKSDHPQAILIAFKHKY